MFKLNPKTRWRLIRIIPFGIIWLVVGTVSLTSDILAIGDNPAAEGGIKPNLQVFILASVATFMVGLIVGTMEVVLVNRFFRKKSMALTILYKFLLYTIFLLAVVAMLYPIAASMSMNVPINDSSVREQFMTFWGSYAFWSTVLQLTFSLLLSLLYAAIAENLGHSVLLNFFTGKYNSPKQEERIFMFLDMKSSTTIAESLGHVRYFDLLQRYYDDLSEAIIQHEGEVYQYVGDEIVITWQKHKGITNKNCVRCFFAMKQALAKKAPKYLDKFGHAPTFKAGMHLGTVTTGEVGALKKEIVFTGDVLNTTARIQSLCNELGHDLLVSSDLERALDLNKEFKTKELGQFELKGKYQKISIFGLTIIE